MTTTEPKDTTSSSSFTPSTPLRNIESKRMPTMKKTDPRFAIPIEESTVENLKKLSIDTGIESQNLLDMLVAEFLSSISSLTNRELNRAMNRFNERRGVTTFFILRKAKADAPIFKKLGGGL